MKVTIEISMYPLRSDYEEQVLTFIKYLREDENLAVKVNALSTQVTGHFDQTFAQIQKCIKKVYENGVKASFVIKVLHGELDLNFNL